MKGKDRAYRFPYQHLTVLGVEKMKKYVPPPPPPPFFNQHGHLLSLEGA